jgi:anthranilate phosphoribosyltransferase
MFAPSHHSAMKHAAPVRRELGVRTIFNILGPLTNPAGAPNQVMGVFHPDLVGIQARVLQRLGSRHVMVVHGEDGLDEISPAAETFVAELKNDEVVEYKVHPRRFGMKPADLAAIRVDDPVVAKRMLLEALEGLHPVARDVVALNAGAAIYTAGLTDSLEAGVRKALEVIESGAARARLDEFVTFTNRLTA